MNTPTWQAVEQPSSAVEYFDREMRMDEHDSHPAFAQEIIHQLTRDISSLMVCAVPETFLELFETEAAGIKFDLTGWERSFLRITEKVAEASSVTLTLYFVRVSKLQANEGPA